MNKTCYSWSCVRPVSILCCSPLSRHSGVTTSKAPWGKHYMS